MDIVEVKMGFRRWRPNLFSDTQKKALLINGINLARDLVEESVPVAYLRHKESQWLISALFQENLSYACGIEVFGSHIVTIGNIDLAKIYELSRRGELINDFGFSTSYNLSTFIKVAEENGRFTVNEDLFGELFEKHSSKSTGNQPG